MSDLVLGFNEELPLDLISAIFSVQRGGKVEIIANDQGNRITPSWVAFTEDERLIGDAAKNQAPQNPINTVFDAKRLIGRTFDDNDVQKDVKHWPFKLVNKNNKPMIQVNHRGDLKDFVSGFPRIEETKSRS